MTLPASLRAALQLLTRLPVHAGRITDADPARSLYWYPVVGVLIGASLHALASWPTAAHGTLAALVLLAWVAITGALHLDGLADSADAWLGGYGDRTRSLEIMRDPRIGAAGACAVALILIGKFAALVALVEHERTWILLGVCALARCAVPLLYGTTEYVRPGGLGEALARASTGALAWKVVTPCVLAVTLLSGVDGLVSAGAMAVLFLACRHLMCRRLGGATGDTTGATIEVLETGALMAVALRV